MPPKRHLAGALTARLKPTGKPALAGLAGRVGVVLAQLPSGDVLWEYAGKQWKLGGHEVEIVSGSSGGGGGAGVDDPALPDAPATAAAAAPSGNPAPRKARQRTLVLTPEGGPQKGRSEDDEQALLFDWAWGPLVKDPATGEIVRAGGADQEQPELARLYHVPNGGYRSAQTAGRLRQLGVRPGVFDLGLDLPRGPYHGWRGELKRQRGGAPSPAQLSEQEWLIGNGYWAEVHFGWEAARRDLLRYLALPRPPQGGRDA